MGYATAMFTGAVFALQSGRVYALFNMETMVGATVGLSLTREIGPVFAAIMVTARACSAMAAELGTMRVTEQIDALETMAVNPIHYLVVPRIIACTVAVPLLTMLYDYVGVVGAYTVGISAATVSVPASTVMRAGSSSTISFP
jgi:phospholipid/cholesterol/gamma-HCH transport system permease protein